MEQRKLTGRDGAEDIVVNFEEVDFVGAKDVDALLAEVTDGKIIKAKKDAVVKAWPAKLGEKVITRPGVLVDGKAYTFSETEIVIGQKEIDNQVMLIQNPDGEIYSVKGAKFATLYNDLGDGTYRSVGQPKTFVTTTKDICFKASWGETQYAIKGSKLCIDSKGDIYAITNMAFATTYKEIENENVDEDESEL